MTDDPPQVHGIILPSNPAARTGKWYRYEVGQLYNPQIRYWAAETPSLRMTADYGIELALFYHGPTSVEIQAVRNGLAQFAWIDTDGPVGVLAFRFGTLNWADCPFTPHRKEPDYEPGLPELVAGRHLTVVCPLVDATTGIIKAIRLTTWPAEFATAVKASVDRMREAPYTKLAHDAALDGLYAYETYELVQLRSAARCVGGRP